MSVVHEQVVIANNASDSGEFACPDRVIVGIYMPSAWTTADIALYAAPGYTGTGLTYQAVFDTAGTQVLIVPAASTYVVIPPDTTRGLLAVKFKSVTHGTPGTPVNQGAARTLIIATIEDIRS